MGKNSPIRMSLEVAPTWLLISSHFSLSKFPTLIPIASAGKSSASSRQSSTVPMLIEHTTVFPFLCKVSILAWAVSGRRIAARSNGERRETPVSPVLRHLPVKQEEELLFFFAAATNGMQKKRHAVDRSMEKLSTTLLTCWSCCTSTVLATFGVPAAVSTTSRDAYAKRSLASAVTAR